jgi:hypothetical protein
VTTVSIPEHRKVGDWPETNMILAEHRHRIEPAEESASKDEQEAAKTEVLKNYERNIPAEVLKEYEHYLAGHQRLVSAEVLKEYEPYLSEPVDEKVETLAERCRRIAHARPHSTRRPARPPAPAVGVLPQPSSPAKPVGNAACPHCGAPALALFSSIECLRAGGCWATLPDPIVPEPLAVWIHGEQRYRYAVASYCVVVRGHFTTVEGAKAAWLAAWKRKHRGGR